VGGGGGRHFRTYTFSLNFEVMYSYLCSVFSNIFVHILKCFLQLLLFKKLCNIGIAEIDETCNHDEKCLMKIT
jgi:hypothetical protein